MVQQTSWRRDYDVDTILERAHLRLHADTAVHRDKLQPCVAPVGARAVQNLLGELAGGYQHERSERAAAITLEALQDGQQKCRCLPGSRLSRTDQVAAFQT
jgi:hypothetical protein